MLLNVQRIALLWGCRRSAEGWSFAGVAGQACSMMLVSSAPCGLMLLTLLDHAKHAGKMCAQKLARCISMWLWLSVDATCSC